MKKEKLSTEDYATWIASLAGCRVNVSFVTYLPHVLCIPYHRKLILTYICVDARGIRSGGLHLSQGSGAYQQQKLCGCQGWLGSRMAGTMMSSSEFQLLLLGHEFRVFTFMLKLRKLRQAQNNQITSPRCHNHEGDRART